MIDSVIETLASLQAIDRRNRERAGELADLEREAAELQAELEIKRSQAEIVRAETSAAATRRRELEALVHDEERRLKERRMRLNRIRNEKELDAARREIDQLKELHDGHETDLVELLEQDKTVDGGLQGIEQELQQLEERARLHADNRASRAAALRHEMDSEREERERIAGLLAVPIRRRYEQIFERRGGIAVVEMRGGSCLGCKMSLPPQLGNEVRKGMSVITCPSCHRILYWRPESSDAAGAEEA